MIDEPESLFGGRENWERLFQKARKNRIPILGSMFLTSRCNLRCVHCYLHTPSMCEKLNDDLPTDRIHRLIDEVASAGCLFFSLIGEEPLLHKDFFEIFRHLKQCGIGVRILTNGTLIRDEHVKLFGELQPHLIRISLYGASRETYENVTRVSGSYEKCVAGIRRLVEARIPVCLAFPVLSTNKHELPAMKQMALKLGVPFALNIEIHATANGDMAPTQLRVPAEEAVAFGASDPEILRHWREYAKNFQANERLTDDLFDIDIGSTKFHVTADGLLTPSPLIRDTKFIADMRTTSFLEGWNGPLAAIKKLKTPENSTCISCAYRAYCLHCTAVLLLEGVDFRAEFPIHYCCEVAKARWEVVSR